ncbi:hypothetical protein IFM89_025261 [Coptis chinensis]|uniref:Late embryogenesis abundant protein LEA-2 subgroup domain-containing protein n=1 Tax=Coptis chinensis TaxID=261450 RepID=A0A835I568_9MAGN|nr:hypothetical protein IFM89_025261 [Coptis chinensis]
MANSSTCCSGYSYIFLRLITFFLCIGFVVSSYVPSFFIEKFYVPALDKSSIAILNTTIFFYLRVSRVYSTCSDSLNVTIYFGQNNSGAPMGHVSLSRFGLGPDYERVYRNKTVTTVGVPWEIARREVSSNQGITLFQLRLNTIVRARLSILLMHVMLICDLTVMITAAWRILLPLCMLATLQMWWISL